jgi:hypothetical protein
MALRFAAAIRRWLGRVASRPAPADRRGGGAVAGSSAAGSIDNFVRRRIISPTSIARSFLATSLELLSVSTTQRRIRP